MIFSPGGVARDPLLRAALPGLALAMLALLFGFALGIVFGLNEAAIKSRLSASATAVQETLYRGDPAVAKPVLDKSWEYIQRAHLHAGSLGTAAIAMTLLTVVLGASTLVTRLASLLLGAGALGYSVFWLWAGFRAPGLGSTGAAKESLAWLAIPASGAVVAGTAIVTLVCILALTSAGAAPRARTPR